MKKLFLIAAILIVAVNISNAQKLKPNAVIKAQSVYFKTQQIDRSERISVYNTKNIYHNKTPQNRNPNVTIQRGDKSGMLNAFTQVFSDARLKELLPENILPMTFYLAPSGKVLEVEFLLNTNTSITATELEKLEKAIKVNVWFKLRPEEIKGEDFIDIGQGVRFSRILDRTLK